MVKRSSLLWFNTPLTYGKESSSEKPGWLSSSCRSTTNIGQPGTMTLIKPDA
ncbi:hypothetical protein COLO4_01647 [Corchorus olitorius]|uniref:Uncharacterized protein n=1 Tax=Corchorus olitorius TaxID=93759 RepID=A0A1R3L2E9_9ROSI|nr:hypothetical protein COLO4_01647 [Corchorus olitorius]